MQNNVYILSERVEKPVGAIFEVARKGRQKALLSISGYCVKVADSDQIIRKFWSDSPPSLGELAETFGTDTYLVSITRERKPSRTFKPAPFQ